MFEEFTVRGSIGGFANTTDLLRGDEYLGSYKSIQHLMLDLSLRWGQTEFIGSKLWSFTPEQIPKYRGVFRRWFEPIDFGERLVTFSNSLTEIINFLADYDDFCSKNEKYFSNQGTGIHVWDPVNKTYELWENAPTTINGISGITDLNVQVKQSDEVKSNLIDRETSDLK